MDGVATADWSRSMKIWQTFALRTIARHNNLSTQRHISRSCTNRVYSVFPVEDEVIDKVLGANSERRAENSGKAELYSFNAIPTSVGCKSSWDIPENGVEYGAMKNHQE